MTSSESPQRPGDFAAADLRIHRGSIPASVQLAAALKAHILKYDLGPGARLPTERELIARSGLSRVTVRAAVGMLEKDGWLIRRQGLGTFVAEPVQQQLGCGVRTITEVLASQGLTPHVEVLSHRVIDPPRFVADTLGLAPVMRIQRRYSCSDRPLALVTAYLPANLPNDAVQPLLSADSTAETTYTMWEQRLGIRIGSATHKIHAAAASPAIAAALDLTAGAPVLVLRRTSFTDAGKPLEVVTFHHRPEQYQFAVTLPRTTPDREAGLAEMADE